MNRVQKLLAAGFTAVAMMSAASAASATNYNITLVPLPGGTQTAGFSATVVGVADGTVAVIVAPSMAMNRFDSA